jgi:hypothetical protein
MVNNVEATVMNKLHARSPLRDLVIILQILDQGENGWK